MLVISDAVRAKLAGKHGVTEDEIIECFANRTGKFLIDSREEHRTDPPTLWFVSQTDYGKLLKVVFVKNGDKVFIKTAYQANREEIRIYKKFG